MCRPLQSVDVRKFKDVKETMKSIDAELGELAEIAAQTDFADAAHAAQFARNVVYLKTYFEHCERLIREQQDNERSSGSLD